jgi:hypothetical protein
MNAASRLKRMRKDWMFWLAAVLMAPLWLPMYVWVVIEEWQRKGRAS